MLRVLFLFLGFSGVAIARGTIWYQDNAWLNVQAQHLQTQLQLQAQDQYSRMLLLQDQERQIEKLIDQERQVEFAQRNMIMQNHANRLLQISRTHRPISSVAKQKLR